MSFHRELIEHSPMHGRWTYLEFDTDDPESCTIVDEFDMAHMQKVLDRNAVLKHTSMKNEFGHIAASVPAGVKELWRQQYGIDYDNPDHADGVTRLLNDSDWRKLRIWEGRL